MNFWKRLRLIGSVIVLAISVLAIVLALLHARDTDGAGDATPGRPTHPLTPLSGTTGL